MKSTFLTLAAALWLGCAASAWAACGVTSEQIKDNAGTTSTWTALNDGTNCAGETGLVVGTAALGATNPLPVTPGTGSTFTVTQATAANLNATVTGTVAATETGAPWTVNLTQLDSTALGAPSAYGTAPGAGNYLGVNAFVTNTAGANLAQVAGGATATSATGVQKVGVVGNAGAALDTAVGGSAAANAMQVQGAAGMTPVQVSQATAANLNAQVAQTASVPTSGTLQSAAVANGNGATLATAGMASAILTVNCASCTGGTTVNFEGTEDGSDYSGLMATQLGTPAGVASLTTTAGLTYWQVAVAGLQNIRARISSYGAGTVTVTGHTLPMSAPGAVAASLFSAGVPLTNTGGALNVDLSAAIPSGANTIGGVKLPDIEAGLAPGAAPSDGLPVLGQWSSTLPTVSSSGNTVALQTDSNGRLLVGAIAGQLPSGTNTIGGVSQVGTWTVSLNSSALVIGKVGIDQTTPGTTNAVQVIPGTSGGANTFSEIVPNSVTAGQPTAVDANPGQIYGIRVFSNNTTIVYGKLYNAAVGSVTCGSGTPHDRFEIPAQTGGSGFVVPSQYGQAFGTAITLCITGGIADTDTTPPSGNSYLVSIDYK